MSALLVTIKADELAELRRKVTDITARSLFGTVMTSELSRRLGVASGLLADADERQAAPDWDLAARLDPDSLAEASNGVLAEAMLDVADAMEANLDEAASPENRAALLRVIEDARRDAPLVRAVGEAGTATVN